MCARPPDLGLLAGLLACGLRGRRPGWLIGDEGADYGS
jgi:hypothetical protein